MSVLLDRKRAAAAKWEERAVLKALKENGWNISDTAKALKMGRENLHRIMRRHKIVIPSGHGFSRGKGERK